MADTTRKRRWFAFRLRTLLVVFLVLGSLLTPLALKLQQARKQRQVVDWMRENGAAVGYDWQSTDATSPPGPEWFRSWIGDEIFQTVRFVNFSDSQVKDLKRLRNVSSLQELHFSRTRVSDLSALKKLTNLRELGLSETQVSDLSPLQGLTNLQVLHLQQTMVSDLTPLKQLTNLQRLDIRWTPVRDLSPLQKLPNLQVLHLANSRFSDLLFLDRLKNLRELHLHYMKVSDRYVSIGMRHLPFEFSVALN